MTAVRHVEFKKKSYLVTWLSSSSKCAVVYLIRSKSDSFSLRYSDLMIFKTADVRQLEFAKFRVYVTWALSPCYFASLSKFHWNQTIGYWVLAKKHFFKWRILNFRDSVTSSLKRPWWTSYRASIETIALDCFVFGKIAFLYAFWRQMNKQTNGLNRWTSPLRKGSFAVASVVLITECNLQEIQLSPTKRAKVRAYDGTSACTYDA